MRKTVFLIAGEESGDVLGGGLMAAMKEAQPEVRFIGVGGDAMTREGLSSLMPMQDLCVMGLFEVVMQMRRLLKLIDRMVEEIEKAQPDVVIGIDLPDFNFRVAKLLKKRGIYKGKILHYVAPSVWAWRPGRAKYVAGFLDGLMCLFPFEPEYFTKHGLKAAYVGHSIIEQDATPDRGMRKDLELGDDTLLIGLYLGSREQEVKRHGAVFCEALNAIYEESPNTFVLVPTLPHLEYEVRKVLEECQMPFFVSSDAEKKWAAMKACDVAMAVSGTVGLELSYMNIPHLIAYRANGLTAFVIKMLVKTKYAHLTNIILQKAAVPEFLQKECDDEIIAGEFSGLLESRDAQKEDFAALRAALTQSSDEAPSRRAAAFVAEFL
ncbi:MAG: lipid-A-disaccharide synthase [Alphaproteobacteria bacterium]